VTACGAVAAIALLYRYVIHVNPTTIALTLLLMVLVVSATWGLHVAVSVAVIATLAFNYFFLPPYGTFAISDPQNWIALFVFLVTAVIASELAERARREAQGANERRLEAERLYGYSQLLLANDNVAELLNSIPGYMVESFDVRAAAIALPNRLHVYRSNPDLGGIDLHDLRLVCNGGEPKTDAQTQVMYMPLRVGARVVGSFALSGELLSRETLEAMSSLTAIAIERAGAIEKLGRAEAARESEQLRSVLMDSVSHEFRTPLTAIKASVTSLLGNQNFAANQRQELLTVIDEEADRLNRLVGEAAEMAQLDANKVELQLGQYSMQDAVAESVREARQALGKHPVQIQVPENLPSVKMDVHRVKEVLIHLLENASKYSAPDAPIHITAEARDGELTTSVADHGPGIDEFEQSLIFDKFYRGRNQRARVQGTGMGLAIAKAIVAAHGGRMGVTSQLGYGSVFYFSLPI